MKSAPLALYRCDATHTQKAGWGSDCETCIFRQSNNTFLNLDCWIVVAQYGYDMLNRPITKSLVFAKAVSTLWASPGQLCINSSRIAKHIEIYANSKLTVLCLYWQRSAHLSPGYLRDGCRAMFGIRAGNFATTDAWGSETSTKITVCWKAHVVHY